MNLGERAARDADDLTAPAGLAQDQAALGAAVVAARLDEDERADLAEEPKPRGELLRVSGVARELIADGRERLPSLNQSLGLPAEDREQGFDVGEVEALGDQFGAQLLDGWGALPWRVFGVRHEAPPTQTSTNA